MTIADNLISGTSPAEAMRSLTESGSSTDAIGMMFAAMFEEGVKTSETTNVIRTFKALTDRDLMGTFLEDEPYFRAIARLLAHFGNDDKATMDRFDPETHLMLIENPAFSDSITQFAASGRVRLLSEITPEMLAETLKTEPALRSGVL